MPKAKGTKDSPFKRSARAKAIIAEGNREFYARQHGTADDVKTPQKKPRKLTQVDKSAPVIEVIPERDWCRKVAHVPFISTVALRAFIEAEAAPLRKVIALANGHEVNGHMPSFDDQKAAIYALLPKVAPDLKSVEVTYDQADPGTQTERTAIFKRYVDALDRLALGQRPQQIDHEPDEDDGGQD